MTGVILSLCCSPVVGSIDADSWVERFGGELNVQVIAFPLLLLSKDRVLGSSEISGDGKGVGVAKSARLFGMIR